MYGACYLCQPLVQSHPNSAAQTNSLLEHFLPTQLSNFLCRRELRPTGEASGINRVTPSGEGGRHQGGMVVGDTGSKVVVCGDDGVDCENGGASCLVGVEVVREVKASQASGVHGA
jgi:hypothetical protein